MDKQIIIETAENALPVTAGKIICDSIITAEIAYKDLNGQVVVKHDIGRVFSGHRINVKVPEPGDFTITMLG